MMLPDILKPNIAVQEPFPVETSDRRTRVPLVYSGFIQREIENDLLLVPKAVKPEAWK